MSEVITPLYNHSAKTAREQWDQDKGNAGLFHQKFFDQWASSLTSPNSSRDLIEPEGKRRWLENFARRPVGNSKLIDECLKRRARLIRGQAERARAARFQTQWRFVTGTGYEDPVENGFAWHHTLGTPFLPGSGLKGVVRSWAMEWAERENDHDEAVLRIFGGAEGGVGSVIFFDALPTKPVRLEVDVTTVHYGEWYRQDQNPPQNPPADWHSPTPIPFLTVAPGQEFFVGVSARNDSLEDMNLAWKWLVDALCAIGAGAKTAAGYGCFVIVEDEPGWLEQLSYDPDLEKERIARLDPAERVQILVAQLDERDALDFVLKNRNKTELDEETMLYKEALADRFAASWARGESANELGISPDKLRDEYVSWLRPELLEVEDDNDAVEPHPLLDPLADDTSSTYKQSIEDALDGYEDAGLSDEQLSYLYEKVDDFWKTRGRKLKKKDPLRQKLIEARKKLKKYET